MPATVSTFNWPFCLSAGDLGDYITEHPVMIHDSEVCVACQQVGRGLGGQD